MQNACNSRKKFSIGREQILRCLYCTCAYSEIALFRDRFAVFLNNAFLHKRFFFEAFKFADLCGEYSSLLLPFPQPFSAEISAAAWFLEILIEDHIHRMAIPMLKLKKTFFRGVCRFLETLKACLALYSYLLIIAIKFHTVLQLVTLVPPLSLETHLKNLEAVFFLFSLGTEN